MRVALAVLLLCGSIMGCTSFAQGSLPASGAEQDDGGSVIQRLAHIAALERAGTEFVVPRMCYSACTLYIGLSTACFREDGWLGFHSSWYNGASTAETEDWVSRFNFLMASVYAVKSVRLANWFLEGPAKERKLTMVRASELIERGEVRGC